MVYRVYVEKRPGLTVEADALRSDLVSFLGISSVEGVRILNRYDAEGLDGDLFDYAKNTVFSEPQVDVTYDALVIPEGSTVFAVEYLPGQYDQRGAVHSDHLARHPSDRALREGLYPDRRTHERGRERDQKIRHQPRGGTRSKP